jgi:hypothetical protein
LRWKRARFAVPVAIIAAIGGGALVPTLSGATAPPSLPSVTAQQLLAEVLQAKPPALSGTLTWTANLGLSDLSTLETELGQGGNGSGDDSAFDPLSLLAGSYQIEVWLGGPTAEHLAMSESSDEEVDVIRNGNQVWLWDSTGEAVTHLIVTPGATPPSSPPPTPPTPALTPSQVAARLLSHVGPGTSVTTGTTLYVAGQPAYQLLVTPQGASGSTIDHIEIDVGASGTLQGVPLQVAIYASGQTTPALELGFTGQLSLGQPPASELTFTPPPGSKVTTHTLGRGQLAAGSHGQGDRAGDLSRLHLSKVGTGWTTILTGTGGQPTGANSSSELSALTTVVQVGGQQARLFSTDLFNALILPDGRFYAGFVTPSVLEAAATSSLSSP